MAEEEEQAEGGKGGNKMLIIIIGVVLVLVLGGVGAFFAMGSSGGDGEGEEEFEEEFDEEETLLPNAILPLETFIVNLQVKGSFLKTTLQLEFSEPELPPTVESDIPKIRDTIIRILSSKSASDMLNPEGKENLREEIRDGVNETLGAEDVTQVYFTEFIIQ